MTTTPTDRLIAFDRFSLDLVNECLWRGSEEIKIGPKAFAVLNYLLNRSGQLVTKEELLNAVWPETFVGDAVLKVTVRQLREALDDDPKSPRFIETAHRRGYRFIGESIAEPAPPKQQVIQDDSHFRHIPFGRVLDLRRCGGTRGGAGAIATLAPEDAARRTADRFCYRRSRHRQDCSG